LGNQQHDKPEQGLSEVPGHEGPDAEAPHGQDGADQSVSGAVTQHLEVREPAESQLAAHQRFRHDGEAVERKQPCERSEYGDDRRHSKEIG